MERPTASGSLPLWAKYSLWTISYDRPRGSRISVYDVEEARWEP